MAGQEGEGAPFVQAEGKASQRPDAKAEFRRAYLILAVFAILIIAAFMATKSRASGSDLKRFTQGKDTNLEDQNDLENGFSSTSELPDIQGESASAVENLIEAVYDSGQEAEEGAWEDGGVMIRTWALCIQYLYNIYRAGSLGGQYRLSIVIPG